MKAYKLFRQRKDGSLGPLFINCRQRVPIGEWLEAESHPTKGYAYRPGWHCTLLPVAPHLKMRSDRVWAEVMVAGWKLYDRPESQGGAWVLADFMKVIRLLTNEEVLELQTTGQPHADSNDAVA